jgi:hypothetical protein
VALVLVPVAIVAGPLTPTTGKVLTVVVATAIWVLSLRTSTAARDRLPWRWAPAW